jgi:hypothetical protein
MYRSPRLLLVLRLLPLYFKQFCESLDGLMKIHLLIFQQRKSRV